MIPIGLAGYARDERLPGGLPVSIVVSRKLGGPTDAEDTPLKYRSKSLPA